MNIEYQLYASLAAGRRARRRLNSADDTRQPGGPGQVRSGRVGPGQTQKQQLQRRTVGQAGRSSRSAALRETENPLHQTELHPFYRAGTATRSC